MYKKPKKYCIAAGCRNNEKNSDHAFFFLPAHPKDAARLRKWLTALGREDLLEKDLKKYTRYVCCAHFDESSIKISKSLQDNAVPTLLLANEANATSSAQPESAEFKDTTIVMSKSTESVASSSLPSGSVQIQDKEIVTSEKIKENTKTQTNNQEPLSKQTQTLKLVTEGTRKRKLSGDLKQCKRKDKIRSEITKIKQELEAKIKRLRALMLMEKLQGGSKS